MILGISWTDIFQTISQIMTAVVAITAFSLLLYLMVYNLREQVVRAFILILLCVAIVYTTESLASVSDFPILTEVSLNIKWAGIVFLPATYLFFADSLLTLTGKPSRGRRIWVVRCSVNFDTIFFLNSFRCFDRAISRNQPSSATFSQNTSN